MEENDGEIVRRRSERKVIPTSLFTIEAPLIARRGDGDGLTKQQRYIQRLKADPLVWKE